MFKVRGLYSRLLFKALNACLCFMVCMGAQADVQSELAGHDVINIWPGEAPGTEHWSGVELSGTRSITNVTVPTLTVFYPDPGVANGSAVVVCPGGGFTGLAMIEEGTLVAEWLAARGITAYILKYRVRPSNFSRVRDNRRERLSGLEIATADGIQAMRVLRANAVAYNIDPDRIGMVGFSAGAMTTMNVVMTGEPEDIPNFAAPIYGAILGGSTPSPNSPPAFIVHAQDDPVVPPSSSINIYNAWSSAGLPVELHIYEKGGHGFGALNRNMPTDLWMQVFERWLIGHGWIDISTLPPDLLPSYY